jgi:hypothetical protein
VRVGTIDDLDLMRRALYRDLLAEAGHVAAVGLRR